MFDFDDARWRYDVALFNEALAGLAGRPDVRAVVIRSGATVSAREAAAELVGATETLVFAVPVDECVRRIKRRGRPRPPLYQQVAAAKDWWRKYEPVDAVLLRSAAPSREW